MDRRRRQAYSGSALSSSSSGETSTTRRHRSVLVSPTLPENHIVRITVSVLAVETVQEAKPGRLEVCDDGLPRQNNRKAIRRRKPLPHNLQAEVLARIEIENNVAARRRHSDHIGKVLKRVQERQVNKDSVSVNDAARSVRR